jgi:hypothetical protein
MKSNVVTRISGLTQGQINFISKLTQVVVKSDDCNTLYFAFTGRPDVDYIHSGDICGYSFFLEQALVIEGASY